MITDKKDYSRYTFKKVAEAVCKIHAITLEDLKGRSRLRYLVEARMLYAYAIKKIYDKPLTLIGRYIGRDHSTICYYIDFVKDQMKISQEYNDLITGQFEIVKRLTGKKTHLNQLIIEEVNLKYVKSTV